MDTHVTSAAELDLADTLSARLPGEPDPETFAAVNSPDKPEPLTPHPAPSAARRRRPALLAGAALGVVVLAVGAFVLSPYNHVVRLPPRVAATAHQLATAAGLGRDRPLAPAASLASVHLPARPPAVVSPPYEPKRPDQDLKEILAMRPGSKPAEASRPAPAAPAMPPRAPTASPQALPPATPSPASASAARVAQIEPPPGFVPHEPGAVTTPSISSVAGNAEKAKPATVSMSQPTHHGTRDVTQAVVAAATAHEPLAPSPSAKPTPGHVAAQASTRAAATATAAISARATPSTTAPAPHAAVKRLHAAAQGGPADAVDRARHLQAAPMTDAEQVQVLELVTQMAAMVHEIKQQDASLRADFAKSQEDERAQLKDFERRIALVEARNAITAAVDTPSQAVSGPPAPADTSAVRPVSVTRASAALPVHVPVAAKRYRVQAASPGLAIVTEVDRGGGDGAQLQVMVGDTIPGWGKVKSVSQRGSSWVVSTEHGVIE